MSLTPYVRPHYILPMSVPIRVRLIPYISRSCVSHSVSISVYVSPLCAPLILWPTRCVPLGVFNWVSYLKCVPLRMCSTLCVSHSLGVPLRVYSTLCVSHSVYSTLYVSHSSPYVFHSVSVPLCVSHSMCVSLCVYPTHVCSAPDVYHSSFHSEFVSNFLCKLQEANTTRRLKWRKKVGQKLNPLIA